MSERDRPFYQLVSEGAFPRYNTIQKFGENSDIDTTSTPEDVWDVGGLYTFSTTADITQVTSSSTSDTVDITVLGLDSNWEEVEQIVTLNGQTAVTLSTSLIRVYRAYNIGSTELVGDVYICTSAAAFSAGVPTVSTEIRAKITNGNEQTLMCLYTIPSGHIGYLYSAYATYGKSNSTASQLTLRVRPYGQTFKVKNKISLQGTGTSAWSRVPEFYGALSEKSDILIRCDSVEVNNTHITGGFIILLKEIS